MAGIEVRLTIRRNLLHPLGVSGLPLTSHLSPASLLLPTEIMYVQLFPTTDYKSLQRGVELGGGQS